MKLLRYRIKNFRAVLDTGWIECQPITAFVGSNESGKTTILMALMKLMDPNRKFKVSEHTFKSNIGNLAKINLDADIPIDRRNEIKPVYRETVFIEAVLAADEGINGRLREINPAFQPVETIHITKTLGGVYDLPEILDKFAEHERCQAIDAVLSHMPVFLYFKEVTEFRSDINLAELAYKLAGIRHRALTPRESIFANLLNYLDIWESNLLKSIAEVHGELKNTPETEVDFVKIFKAIPLFKNRFTKGFADLTGDFRKWWGNGDITIGYEVYKKGVRIKFTDKDGRQFFLENRSTGFRRFFALFLSFSVTARQDFENTVLLFDEAGAALHPIMQRKLAAFFRELGRNTQILYNTHTSYMLPVTEMNNARIIYKDTDNRVNINPVMRLAADGSNEESLFVAEASLAMHLAKAAITGCLPIVMLNPEDMYYLQIIKNVLIAKGRLNSVYDLLIYSAGGNGIDFASELYHANGKLPVIILPSDAEGRGVKARLAQGVYRDNGQKLFELSDFTKKTCFAELMPPVFIELFAAEYLAELLGGGFTYDRKQPLIRQIEEYAAKKKIELPERYKGDLARAMKVCMTERYHNPRIPARYMRLWRKIMKTLLQDFPAPAPRAGLAAQREESGVQFALPRLEVFMHVWDMSADTGRFGDKPRVIARTSGFDPDYLVCGAGRVFGIMYGGEDSVSNIILRMNGETAAFCEKKGYRIQREIFFKGGEWYNLTIGSPFRTKEEVYGILDKCCEFSQARFQIPFLRRLNYNT